MKPEAEFFPATEVPYSRCAGDVPGLTERILGHDPDTGTVTRILRFAPGVDTTPNGIQRHDFWEEVYILDGEITDLRLDQSFSAGGYACRPPGMEHGPWISPGGALTFEVRYYAR